MYCVYGNSGWYIHGGPLFRGGPVLGGSRVFNVVFYVDRHLCRSLHTDEVCSGDLFSLENQMGLLNLLIYTYFMCGWPDAYVKPI